MIFKFFNEFPKVVQVQGFSVYSDRLKYETNSFKIQVLTFSKNARTCPLLYFVAHFFTLKVKYIGCVTR